MNLSTHRMLKLLLVINLYRIKFGHFMEIEKDSFNDQSLDFLMQSEGIEGAAQSFESEYNISLDEEVVCQLFVSYFQKMFFIDESFFMKCVKKDSYVEKSYHLLSDFIDQISVKYQIEIENKDNLIWHLHNTAHLYRQ